MRTRTVWQTNGAGFFIGVTVADESPLEPGVWLLPAGAVDTAPPPGRPGRNRGWRWDGERWHAAKLPRRGMIARAAALIGTLLRG